MNNLAVHIEITIAIDKNKNLLNFTVPFPDIPLAAFEVSKVLFPFSAPPLSSSPPSFLVLFVCLLLLLFLFFLAAEGFPISFYFARVGPGPITDQFCDLLRIRSPELPPLVQYSNYNFSYPQS
jgi:hypothetical protein